LFGLLLLLFVCFFPAAELHGDMTQAARLQSLERFRKGEVAFLLATDVAARGLDILGLQVGWCFPGFRCCTACADTSTLWGCRWAGAVHRQRGRGS
jgi:hypothetical protein